MAIHRGDRWTRQDDKQLLELIAQKASPTLISAKLRRSTVAIRMRLIALRKKMDRGKCQSGVSQS